MANNQIKFDVGFSFNKTDLNTLTSALKNIQQDVSKASGTGQLTEELKRAGIAATQLESILNQAWNSKLGQLDLSKVNNSIKTTYGSVAELKRVMESSGASGAAAYNKFASSILNTNMQLKQTNKLIDNMFTSIKNVFQYNISASIFNNLTGALQQAFSYTTKLDTSLNDIRIVTDKSAESMERFARQANDAAKNLGASTLDYTNASLIYFQQGLSDEEVQARAETTIKAANVTGQKGEEVSEQLTAVWNGYKVSAQETELYVDKLAAVAATTAADLEELSVGMSKVASAANAMGVDFDDLNAQIATIVSVTRQAPESVGTALKTIYARLGDLKVDGVDEFGTKLGEVSAQMQQMGIQILDQNGDLRDMSSIIAEVAEKWTGWTSAQRQAAAVAMAGKRQYNNLIALFDNWDMYTSALNTSTEAMGTLQHQQDIYMESTAAHLQKLKTESQETYDILFNQDDVNDFADALTGLLSIFNNFLDALGGGKEALVALGAIGARVFNEQIGTGLGNMVLNMERANANKSNENLKQQVIDAHAAQGDTLRADVVNEEAKILERTLAVQKGLTDEQYNQLMNLQQKVGLQTEEIAKLKSAQEILKQEGYSENLSLNSLKKVIQSKEKELQLQKDLLTYLELGTQNTNALSQQQKERLEAVEYINNEESEEAQILMGVSESQKRIYNTLNDTNLTEQRRETILKAQAKAIQDQEQLINQLKISEEGLEAQESGRLTQLEEEKNANERIIEEEQRQAELRQTMQAYVQTLSSLVMTLQVVSSTVKVLSDDTLSLDEKLEKVFSLLVFNLPMLLSTLPALKTSLAGLSVQMGLFSTTTEAAKIGVLGLSKALLATPVGWIVAGLTVLIGTLTLVEAHYKKVKEEARKAAEEAQESADALKKEADAHKDLVEEYSNAYEQYKQGAISKEELWTTTDKLIDAYGLESERLHMLTGDYEAVTKAIKEKQKAEAKELVRKNEENVKASAKNIVQQSRGSFSDAISVDDSAKTMTVDLATGVNTQNWTTVKDIGKKYFGEDFGYSGYSFTFGTDPAELQAGLENILAYRDKLVEALGEESTAVQELDKVISQLNEGGLEDFLGDQKSLLDSLLSGSGLETAQTQEEFDASLEELQQHIKEEINKGLLTDSDGIDDAVKSYIGKIHSSFADQFIIDETIKEKYGEGILSLLQGTDFYKYDKDTQSAIINFGFDFSNLNPEEGKTKLDAYAKFITGNQQGIYSIPVSFQDQINDTVLKGKDVNKGDWTSMQANLSPEANQILGDREEFNNKSIGERIALLQQVNELTRENNLLAIQDYETNKANAEIITKDLEEQEQSIQKQIKEQQRLIDDSHTSSEYRQKAYEELEKLQQQLVEISSKKHTIEISLDMDVATDNIVQSIVGDVMTEADQIKAAAESIGEGWTVAAEDVATFAAAFPELMEGMERQADGSLKLSKEIVNAELEGAQARIDANKQVAIKAAEDKIKQLKLELQLLEQEKKILQEALNGEKDKAETEKALRDAVSDYENQLLQNGLISQADALTKAATSEKEGVDNMINILGGLNDAINIIHNNYANMLTNGPMQAFDAAAGAVKNITAGTVSKNISPTFNTDDIDVMINRIGELDTQISNTKTQIASYEGFVSEMMNSVSEMDKAANRVQKGQAGKEPKSKSGGKDKDKDLKKLEEEFDRYWEIHKALDQLDRDLQKLDKDQENLYGYELIRSLKQENELLANQAQLYEQLAAAQEAEAAELRGKLASSGVAFDASGAVINYAQATAEALKKYNDAVNAYNAGLLDDAAFKIHEKAFEEFKKNLERYDTLFYSEMKETQEKLDEIRRKTLANNLKAWEVEIQLKLDFKELRREWNDFIKEVTSDFKKVFKDLRVEMKNMLKDAKTYIGDDGTIGTIIDAIHTVTGEIDKMMGGGTSDMFESVSQAQEKLKELNSQLQEAGRALHDLWKEAWDAYLDGIDQVADKFDDLMDRFEKINDELEFQGKLIELLYGDEAYQLMSKLYEGQLNNTKAQIQSLKQQADMWKEMFDASGATMENQANWTEDQKKYYEQWMEAQGKLNDMVISYIELLKKDYLNTVKATLQQFEKYITNGKGISKVREEWERIKENAEKYYDSVEKSYQIQTLANKIDQSITDSNSLQVQQKLMKFREKELSYLREKEKLTEYDIKAAEARYQIALKEIALQDAQNNKTSMKLTRNEQGNWSYQYVADEEDVASKQQDLLDAYNQLYQLASDAYEANLEAMIDLYEKYNEKAIEIAQNDNLTQQEKEEALKALWEQYYADLEELAGENALYRNDLAQSGAMMLKEIYLQDQEAIQGMTEAERELINNLVNSNIDDYMSMEEAFVNNYNNIKDAAFEVMAQIREDWSSAAQEIADLWNADNGSSVKNQLQAAYDAIIEASKQYQEAVDECAKIVERDFSEEGITGAIEKAKDATDALKNKTVEMVNESIPYLKNLKNYVDQIENAWKGVQQEILNAINLIDEYLRKIGEANNAGSQSGGAGGGNGSGGGTGNGSNGGKNPGGGTPKKASDDGYSIQDDPYGVPGNKGIMKDGRYVYIARDEVFDANAWARSHGYDSFKTGGYTGSWNNDSGKLAMLHQKELVLNADDTKNFLSGINMIRQLSSGLNGSIENAVLRAAANTALSLGGIRSNPSFGSVSNNNSTDNVFNITAEFPNANSVDDIREAILSLPNLASQYVNSNLR